MAVIYIAHTPWGRFILHVEHGVIKELGLSESELDWVRRYGRVELVGSYTYA